jgi:hypothetical protein
MEHLLANLLSSSIIRPLLRRISLMSPYDRCCLLCGYNVGGHDGSDSWGDTFRIREFHVIILLPVLTEASLFGRR